MVGNYGKNIYVLKLTYNKMLFNYTLSTIRVCVCQKKKTIRVCVVTIFYLILLKPSMFKIL